MTADSITFEQVRDSARAAGLMTARLVTPRTALIPSATTPGVEYTVWIQDGGTWGVCTCEDGGAHCWHVPAALGLYHAARAPRPSLYSEAPEDSPYLLEVA